jgi:hypothetical protein
VTTNSVDSITLDGFIRITLIFINDDANVISGYRTIQLSPINIATSPISVPMNNYGGWTDKTNIICGVYGFKFTSDYYDLTISQSGWTTTTSTTLASPDWMLKINCFLSVYKVCIPLHYYIEGNDTCTSACSTGYITNTTDFKCISCSLGCATCTSLSACQTCSSSYYLRVDSQCYQTCLAAYYPEASNQTCVSCPLGCATCTSLSACQTCSSTYYLRSNSLCYQTCLAGYYPEVSNQTCVSCP